MGTPIQACGILLFPCESLGITGSFINQGCCSKLSALTLHRRGGAQPGEQRCLMERGWCAAPRGARGSAAPTSLARGKPSQPWRGSEDVATCSKCAGRRLVVGSTNRARSSSEGAGLQGKGWRAACHSYHHVPVGSPSTGHVCTAAKRCCREWRRDRDVTVPGQAAPLLLSAHLNQIAVYNWNGRLFFEGYTLHTIKIHVFFRWSHLSAFPAAPVMYRLLTVSFSITSLLLPNSLFTWSLKENQCFQRIWTATTWCVTKLLGYRIWVLIGWWITLVAWHKQIKGMTKKVLRFISDGLTHCFLIRIADLLLNNFITSHHCTVIFSVIKKIMTILMS